MIRVVVLTRHCCAPVSVLRKELHKIETAFVVEFFSEYWIMRASVAASSLFPVRSFIHVSEFRVTKEIRIYLDIFFSITLWKIIYIIFYKEIIHTLNISRFFLLLNVFNYFRLTWTLLFTKKYICLNKYLKTAITFFIL